MQQKRFKYIILSITFIAMFGMMKNLFGQNSNQPLKEVLKEGAFLVDVRTPAEFEEGSVKGAVNIPLDKISEELLQFKDKKHIVVFCKSGNRSTKAKNLLEQNGFKNVVNGGSWNNVLKIRTELEQEEISSNKSVKSK